MTSLASDLRRSLDARLLVDEPCLQDDERAWWRAHRVDPFILERSGTASLAIATGETFTLVFFGRYDAFGELPARAWDDGLTLYDGLPDAVRKLSAREAAGRLLAGTAGRLVGLDAYGRGGPETKARILNVLRAIGPDAAVAVPLLTAILDDPSEPNRDEALATLASIGPAAAPAVPRLIAMAANDDAPTRAWCLEAFRAIGPAAATAVPLILDVLLGRAPFEADSFLVPLAADALGEIGAIEALPALVQVLGEADRPGVACSALVALGKFGTAASCAVPIVSDWAEGRRTVEPADPEADLGDDPRSDAAEALRRILVHG